MAIGFCLVATHCGGIARPDVGDLCQAGQRIECDCIGHTKGERICSAAGIGYGECICGAGGTDAGGDGGGNIDDSDGPPPATCSSMSAWTGGLRGSVDMTPGRPCIACHLTVPQSPRYTLAGTIYANLRDADDCNGVDGVGVALAVFEDTGRELMPRVQVNRVGNFVSSAALPTAYRVKIIAAGKEHVMQAPVTNGDCNVCHTATGAQGASGRIVRPL